MEGDVSAAIALEQVHSALRQQFGRGNYIGTFSVAAERDHRLVLKQQKDVADLFFLPQCDELLLQAKTGGVVDGAELDERDQNH